MESIYALPTFVYISTTASAEPCVGSTLEPTEAATSEESVSTFQAIVEDSSSMIHSVPVEITHHSEAV